MLDTNSTTKANSQSILHQSVQYLKGVGPKRTEIFGRLGVHKIYDMLYYFPRDYNDRTKIQKISEARIGEKITIQGKIPARRLGLDQEHLALGVEEALRV